MWNKKSASFNVYNGISLSAVNRFKLIDILADMSTVDESEITVDSPVKFKFSSNEMNGAAVVSLDLQQDRYLDITVNICKKYINKTVLKQNITATIKAMKAAGGKKRRLSNGDKQAIKKDALEELYKTAPVVIKDAKMLYDTETGMLFANGFGNSFVDFNNLFSYSIRQVDNKDFSFVEIDPLGNVKDKGQLFTDLYSNKEVDVISTYLGSIEIGYEEDVDKLKKAKFQGDAPGLLDNVKVLIESGSVLSCNIAFDNYAMKVSSTSTKLSGVKRTDETKLEYTDYNKIIETLLTVK